jgi:hypothetical protein
MDKNQFMSFLNSLEGFKTKFREFHWLNETVLMSEHKLCDTVMDYLGDFQDDFAEEGFSIFGKPSFGEFYSNANYSESLEIALNELLDLSMAIKSSVTNDIEFCSLSALTDVLIHNVRKSITLLTFK